ncbi:uncharacterized protein LOC131221391 isoform X1 [Magnolia sinica]|uniref:uncharacterized protein LOC131221391 isoform X1 n=1 Tax=Magnolia sinica TaxID=86752 RepID=UPI002659FE94|nr:uncharacterized protein LOC131221391 isoform X1 [Magnolia sinica]
MAMASKDEPILSRLDRLDIMMGYLEEIRGCNKSAKSSCPSTPTSGTVTTSDGGNSSVNSSPKSLEKRCRPIDAVMAETRVKGTLVDRLIHLENRVLKLSMLMEQEIEEKRKEKEAKSEKKAHQKSLKRLVKSFVKGKPKSKD